jgi:hypothetical protein
MGNQGQNEPSDHNELNVRNERNEPDVSNSGPAERFERLCRMTDLDQLAREAGI